MNKTVVYLKDKRLAELKSKLGSVSKTVVYLKDKSLAELKSQLGSVNKTVIDLKEKVGNTLILSCCLGLLR